MRKKIGIIASDNMFEGRPSYEVDPCLINSLIELDALVYFFPCTKDKEMIYEFVDFLDGLVIVGDRDINPHLYSDFCPKEIDDYSFSEDLAEFLAFKRAKDRGKPVLGIARGFELVNIVLGGSLELLDEDQTFIHFGQNAKFTNHYIDFLEASMAYDIFGKKALVKSKHKNKVLSVGEGLEVTGKSIEGNIEALEGDNLLLINFYPEEGLNKNENTKLFEKFLEMIIWYIW